MKKDKEHTGGIGPEKTAPAEKEGLGDLFRREREARGLGYTEISELTRLRPSFVEAIEEEAWDRLPPPVFVKGFLRSYARVLDLDEEVVLGRFHAVKPIEEVPLPLPLVGPEAGRKKWGRYALAVLVVLALGIYLWMSLPPENGRRVPQKEHPLTRAPTATTGQETSAKDLMLSPPREPEAGASSEVGTTETAPAPVERQVPPPGRPEAPTSGPPPMPVAAQSVAPAPAPPAGAAEQTAGTGTSPAVETEKREEVEVAGPSSEQVMTLRMNVLERTWVRVTVDGGQAKEYIFRPGSQPAWEGLRSFDLSIGNAGGVELSLNDEKIGKLGETGKVVHLRLPQDLKTVRNNR
ncbi:MAG: helix-turn-helix domain-containing protein [Deltaproteobacteria bacterium]|nr:helix-turn-helix domain-containing protein [Deltaproteobacteria bacterium]